MSLAHRLHYYRRIFNAYLLPGKSHLTFWHETPTLNPAMSKEKLGEYYMLFLEKADYAGVHDPSGIHKLDYHGKNWPRIPAPSRSLSGDWATTISSCAPETEERKQRFLAASDWLCANLQPNPFGLAVWNHYFDWEYRDTLKSPWYSGLAQGQGISLLVRAYAQTQRHVYLKAAQKAFECFHRSVAEGGVTFTDASGDLWLEEYIVSPPTHILNGFIWASWGVYDYFLATKDAAALQLFQSAVRTLKANLSGYDLGFWSLYEQSGTFLPMVASNFYHQLHIVQLNVMYKLTGDEIFARFAERWAGYARSRGKRTRALCYKCAFKLCYY